MASKSVQKRLAVQMPDAQPVAQIERDGLVWLDTNPHRLPIGTKLYTAPAQAVQPAPQPGWCQSCTPDVCPGCGPYKSAPQLQQYDQGWLDGYRHGAWANTVPAPKESE